MLARRRFLLLAAALPAVSRVAEARTYPTRPVRLITSAPAGGVADLFARLYGDPESGHQGHAPSCLLWAISGLMHRNRGWVLDHLVCAGELHAKMRHSAASAEA